MSECEPDSDRLEPLYASLLEVDPKIGLDRRRRFFERDVPVAVHAFLRDRKAYELYLSEGLLVRSSGHEFRPGYRILQLDRATFRGIERDLLVSTDFPSYSGPEPLYSWADEAEHVYRHLAMRDEPAPRRVLDLCTGSGAIGLALASRWGRPNSSVTLSDVSERAVARARWNAGLNRLAGLEFVRSDLFAKLEGREFDLIVADPPFRIGPPTLEDADLRDWGGTRDRALTRRILESARAHLAPGGRLVFLSYVLSEHASLGESDLAEWRDAFYGPNANVDMATRVHRADDHCWRLREQKALRNPAPIEQTIVRVPLLRERSGLTESAACGTWIDWIERLKAQGKNFIHYVIGDLPRATPE